MSDLSFLKEVSDPKMLESFLEYCKDDVVLYKAIEKSSNIKELINCLMAAVICIKSREHQALKKIEGILSKHPEFMAALQEPKKGS